MRITSIILVLFLVTACANDLSNQKIFNDVTTKVSDRIAVNPSWTRAKETEGLIRKQVSELLQSELSMDSAVQIALLNNRGLQATYEELGIARADVYSATLLQNPLLSVSTRFPSGGGRANIEFGVTENFLPLLFIPLRRSIAESALEGVKSRVSNEIILFVATVKNAFYDLQGALQDKELLTTALKATEASFTASKQIHAAGNITDLELQNEQVMYEKTKLELAQAESEIQQLREKLTSLLGLWGSDTNWKISERLPDILNVEVDLTEVENMALRSRLDLEAAKTEIEITGKALGLASPIANFEASEIGIDTERDSGGGWLTGPNFAVPLPLFPAGTGASIRAEAAYHAALFRYYDLAVQIRSEARAARDNVVGRRAKIEFIKSSLLPLQHSIVQQSQTHYNAMILSLFALLSAKEAEIATARSLISEVKEYWKAKTMLERVVGDRCQL